MPLLNSILALDFPATDLTSQMNAETVADNTLELLGHILRAQVGQGKPAVLLLEDAHWFDSASWRLVALNRARGNPGALTPLCAVSGQRAAGRGALRPGL